MRQKLMEATDATVYKTYNYDMFQLSSENRDIKPTKIKKLQTSILESDMTADHPIIVNPENIIIDGQHRYHACRNLGFPIYYIVRDLKPRELALLNQNQEAWTVDDWVKHYASLGNPNYQRLRNDSKNSKLSEITIGGLTGHSFRRKEIMSGDLKYHSSDQILLWEVLEELKLFDPKVHPFCRITDYMIAYSRLRKCHGFNLNLLKRHLSSCPFELRKQKDIPDYLDNLIHFYNYHEQAKNRIQKGEL